MEYGKTSVKNGVNYCSRKRLLLLLLFLQITFFVVFYFSCQINVFDCQTMAKSFTVSVQRLWDKSERPPRNNVNNQTTTYKNMSRDNALNSIETAITDLKTRFSTHSSTHSFLQKKNVSKVIKKPNTVIKFYTNESEWSLLGNMTTTSKSHPNMNLLSKSNSTTKGRYNNTFVEGIIRLYNISCTPLHPKVLLYNRIFKTASSSVGEYMRTESSPLNYTLEQATTEDWYKTGDPFPYPDIITRHVEATPYRYAFVGHFFFRHHLGVSRRYTYINIVREPVHRVVSHYAYMRTTMRPRMRIEEMKQSGQWNETLRHCVEMEHRGCESNVMVRFFCGPQSFCKTGSKKALTQAKINIKRYYSAVGLKEDLKSFLRILTVVLPDFFRRGDLKLGYEKQNSQTYFKNVESSVKMLIQNKNSADEELYKFVKIRFRKLVNSCRRQGFII